ncbi:MULTISPECIES: DUF6377 domain-containing protein [unclassified Mucilaginibacter]|uniref:DUF6377 domain-containing protein n=1 Tax=unclassified Mucilaginibacter TaxID=2617802 RepID=UPI002AC9221F|nr:MULTISPECIES: DUF6377 domain-containing protein [unclassified Mucilaginibacter]MEB0263282.1 DUF6377 domain-containing protein [Mucilaginibacter sp. 10I4]MEB0278230.1 DUF6377 domain-containing protein [Mucilaginibacter sp. 10B2]MEB0300984.1 DUF6377 domain-containing protein [Mucilaginibacter sp. 5C4]WPX23875.1 DUF6377 domain-containing protein [Mucilaginibacter sp. 5C4]
MRVFFLFLFILSPLVLAAEPNTSDLFDELKVAFDKKGDYDHQKEGRITALKKELKQLPLSDLQNQFAVGNKLYDEYKSYQYDSAYVYANKLLSVSQALHDKSKQDFSKIKMGFILLSSGMFKETFESMHGINVQSLNDSVKVEYYSIIMRAYYDLATYNNDKHYTPVYTSLANKYIDSAILLSKPGSYDNLYLSGYKKYKNNFNDAATVFFYKLLKLKTLTEHQNAIVESTLSNVFQNTSQSDKSIELLIKATISDIRSSTKETVALFWLAEILYKKGDIKNAYIALEHALADAEFYGARQRKVQIGSLLPIVASEKLLFIEREEKLYIRSLSLITVLTAAVILVSILLYKRNKKLKAKEKIIEKVNEKLMEGTKIKEDYIGYFFNVISGYILQLERIKRSIDTKLPAKKYDDIQLMGNNINIKKERETLFNTFDQVFLKIFPNFVEEFNTLFKKENQIWPKEYEVLTTDLRIFALMRMGITGTEAIAKILEYSEKTIYVYKMRIKAKAIIHGDEFDQRIMAIKAVAIGAKP